MEATVVEDTHLEEDMGALTAGAVEATGVLAEVTRVDPPGAEAEDTEEEISRRRVCDLAVTASHSLPMEDETGKQLLKELQKLNFEYLCHRRQGTSEVQGNEMGGTFSILLLGEGNFSFAALLLQYVRNQQIPVNVTASSIHDRESTLASSQLTKENVELVESLKGEVLFDVDACLCASNRHLSHRRFHRILFNFPHVGGKMKIQRNRGLLQGVLQSARTLLVDEEGAEESVDILVTLCGGQGGTDLDPTRRVWGDTWQLPLQAARACLSLRDVLIFDPNAFPGYVDTGFRGEDKGFVMQRSAVTHVLVKSRCLLLPNRHPDVVSNAKWLPEQCLQNVCRSSTFLKDEVRSNQIMYGRNYIPEMSPSGATVWMALRLDDEMVYGEALSRMKTELQFRKVPQEEKKLVVDYPLLIVDLGWLEKRNPAEIVLHTFKGERCQLQPLKYTYDVAFWLPEQEISVGDVVQCLIENDRWECVHSVHLRDEYQRREDGRQAQTYRVVYASVCHPLSDWEAKGYHKELSDALSKDLGVSVK
ncbi:unnamed protein product [Cyprideis torosa]|uniref:Uncharacterized protein n=1 Tax=Cyprideis torosa TaxID=163714 RepID=A0A7R8ZSF8_9CRUS|nr:unnamed protein product [Cyprideis torosa]CAG0895452.1 unnamed protein product [Cyprideis torosa]